MKESIEQIVDAMPSTKAGGMQHRPKHFKRTRTLGKISPAGLALVVATLTVTAVLGGYFYSLMTVEISGDVEIYGRTVTSVFEFDDTPIEGGTLSMPIDITEITNGDTLIFEHTVANMDMGDWCVDIMSSLDQHQLNPMDPYYGLTFNCTPNHFLISPEETETLTFTFDCNHEFMQPSIYGGDDSPTIWVNITIENVEQPLANDDTYHGVGNGFVAHVLDNDYPDDVILFFSTPCVDYSIVTSIVGDTIVLDTHNAPTEWTSTTFSYTIKDTTGLLSDTATVTIWRI